MKFICAHLGRAKELRLQLRQAPPEGVASDLRCKLVKKNRTWPLLERIDVEVETSIEENHECYIDWYSEDVLSLDFDKRTIVAPNLRQVRMHNVAMPWDPSSVTHLTISTDISVPHGRPRARDLVSQLTRSTNLEVLRIDGCLSRVPRTQTPLGERTTFPHLRKMMLGGTPRQCAFLLNYMDIPPTATLAFSLFLSEAKYAENEATPWEDDDEEAVVAVYTKQTGPFFSSLARCSPRHVTSVTWEDLASAGI
ncbi:hypothetical protein OF83DRAFT_1180830 [Amylostereum chailletii]|nr:hypothetical protein OF83DRAFT_1180830 [Amylostereum chailletii]